MIFYSFYKKLEYFFRHYIYKNYLKKIAVFIKENKGIFLTILIFSVITDILLVKESSDFIIFGLLLFYGILVKISQIKSNFTFLCLTLLTIMFVSFFITGTSVLTEKAAVWFILFLGFGIIHQWQELRH